MKVENWENLKLIEERPGVYHKRTYGDAVQVQYLIFDPEGEVAKFHNHPKNEQFFIVETGEWMITVGKEKKKITSGDIVHIPAGVYHTIELLSNETSKCLEVFCPPLEADMKADGLI
jgi:mannose-6-phosphate isomerase-like protein (cupin superfamily)